MSRALCAVAQRLEREEPERLPQHFAWCLRCLRDAGPPRPGVTLLHVVVLAVLAALALPACTDALRLAQATAVRGLAVAGQGAERAVLAAEQADGDRAIDAVVARGGTATEVDAVLSGVRERWRPALDALDALRAALSTWLAALDAGQTGDWAAVLREACDTVAAVEPLAPAAIGPVASVVKGACP